MEPMSWRHFLFSFEGRIRRADYWKRWMLPVFIVLLILGIIDVALETENALSILASLALFYPGLAVNAKRCHDRGRSGWFLLINLLPLIGVIWYFVETGFLRGTIGDNRFGPDPVPGEPAAPPAPSPAAPPPTSG